MPNRNYTVQSGDRLTFIAARYYGDGAKAKNIVNANSFLSNRPISGEGYPAIYVNDVLIIPELINQPDDPDKIESDDISEIKIIINGKPFKLWETASIKRSFDTIADSFSIQTPWQPPENIDRDVFRPFTYFTFSLYLGGEKIMSGIIVNHKPETQANKTKITISGYSRPGILADVPLPLSMYPFEADGLNLKQIAENVATPYGVSVVFNENPGPVFKDGDKTDIKPGQKIYDYLISLARQRGFVISTDVLGNMIFQRANTEKPTLLIEAGKPPFIKSSASYNGQVRYSSFTAIGTEAIKGAGKSSTIEDPVMKENNIQRPLIQNANDTNSGSLKDAATAMYGRSLAQASSFTVSVIGWRRPDNNELWQDNTQILYKNIGDMVYEETAFLIRDVEYIKNDKTEITQLNIVFPECYNGEVRESYPWL